MTDLTQINICSRCLYKSPRGRCQSVFSPNYSREIAANEIDGCREFERTFGSNASFEVKEPAPL